MNEKVNEIMKIMENITYGFKNSVGENILDINPNWDFSFYYLQTPDELIRTKCGVCFDQVELERKLFKEKNINFKTYFIYISDGDMMPSHTFLVYKDNDTYCWFEHSWGMHKGIHKYKSELELLLDVKKKFFLSHSYVSEDANLFVYEYAKPKSHISCTEFYQYMETQKLIKLNEPLYFYHLVDKKVNMKNGLISLQYMHNNKMYDLFDKYVLKYKDRITNDWNIEKYAGKKTLTREEYIDALKIYRGIEGANYIYFFKYPLYKKLGNKINELAKNKDIYRININDEELQKRILDIFYGFDMSNSDNKVLNKKYYEIITKEKYFEKYDDNEKMNFSKLNHIGISFKDGNCPLKYLEKVEFE